MSKQNQAAGFILSIIFVLLLVGCKRDQALNVPAPANQQIPTTVGVRTTYSDVVNRVAPAVVTIRTQARVRSPRQFPFLNDPFFRRFFGDRAPQPPEQRTSGLGSGVIVTSDGYILTNHHVIDGAEQIRIDFMDQRSLEAKVIGSDPPSDLAVLKIDANGLAALALADSDKVNVGDVVLAVGNPLGVGQTVTMGIISAKGRRTGLSNGSFEDFLQTDAPINRGNSGGPLVDTNGDLVGINSQILSPSGLSIGIGFAIPSNMARDVLDQLVKEGRVRRGHLGVVVQPVTDDIAAALGLKSAKGVIVSQVQTGGAADRAGLRQADVIVALNGNEIADPNSFRNDIARAQPGTTVRLGIIRGGNEQELQVTLGELVAERTAARTENNDSQDSQRGEGGRLGLALQPLTPELARQLGLDVGTTGVVVMQLDPSGPAAAAGISQGDVIEQVNQQAVRSVEDVRAALERSGDGPVLLLVNHRGTRLFVTVRPRE